MNDTRTKIQDTAERLFGENGYDATSLRQIIAEAGVNLAAIHYHFGSKEDLLDEIIKRKAEPVNAERLAMLDEAEKLAGGRPVAVETTLRAMLLPMAKAADEHPEFVKVMGRVIAEGMLASIVQKHFQQVVMRIVAALRRALPQLSDDEFQWRVHFTIGAMAHTMCGTSPILQRSPAAGFRERIERLVAYAAGGLQAPPQGKNECPVAGKE